MNKLQHLEPDYAKINPLMLVPSMEYNGEIIADSKIILNFLMDEFPNKLIPQDDEYKEDIERFVNDFYKTIGAIGPFTFGNLCDENEMY